MRVRKTEARSEEQTGTNEIKPGVRTVPINLVLYSGRGSCGPSSVCSYSEVFPSNNTPQSQMKFVSSDTL